MVPSTSGMAFVAHHDEPVAFLAEFGHLNVDLGHQRAGGVKHLEATPAAFA